MSICLNCGLPQCFCTQFFYQTLISCGLSNTLVFLIITTIMFASENIGKTPITKLQNNPTEDRIDILTISVVVLLQTL